ncbi:MAG: cbb3-type cytochrome c oxidase subunit II [Bradymonadaceae bacterium]
MNVMNSPWTILIGIVFTVMISFGGLVWFPNRQLYEREDAPSIGVGPLEESALRGRRVYSELGCIYCHSQQVRPPGFGSDIERGWGARQTKAADYVHDSPPLLGTMRTGPDLANIGARQPSRTWHYLHLYDPVITSPGSNMPPYAFLFERIQRRSGPAPEETLTFPAEHDDPDHWIVPGVRARDLVDYLLTLNYSRPEASESEHE